MTGPQTQRLASSAAATIGTIRALARRKALQVDQNDQDEQHDEISAMKIIPSSTIRTSSMSSTSWYDESQTSFLGYESFCFHDSTDLEDFGSSAQDEPVEQEATPCHVSCGEDEASSDDDFVEIELPLNDTIEESRDVSTIRRRGCLDKSSCNAAQRELLLDCAFKDDEDSNDYEDGDDENDVLEQYMLLMARLSS